MTRREQRVSPVGIGRSRHRKPAKRSLPPERWGRREDVDPQNVRLEEETSVPSLRHLEDPGVLGVVMRTRHLLSPLHTGRCH